MRPRSTTWRRPSRSWPRTPSQFETLLQSLDNLSTQGRSLLETYYPQIVTQLQTLQAVSSQLAQHQADLAGLLAEIPVADNALPKAVQQRLRAALREHHRLRHPGLGEDDSQPAFTCAPTAAAAPRGTRRDLRRLIVNLIVFFAVSFGLVAYGIVSLLGNPLDSPTTLTTEFSDASGLYPGFEVELNGVPVGTVTSTALTTHGHQGHDAHRPRHERARRRPVVGADRQRPRRAGGEPGARHTAGPAAALTSGANVPAAPDQVPANVGAVVASATRLLKAIPANDLNTLIGELATSLQGQAGNLRTLISAGTTFSKEFVAYQQQFTELLANAPPSLDAITAVAPELRQDLANTAALVQVLAQQKVGPAHAAHRGLVRLQRGRQPGDVAVGQHRLLPARHRQHPHEHRSAAT